MTGYFQKDPTGDGALSKRNRSSAAWRKKLGLAAGPRSLI